MSTTNDSYDVYDARQTPQTGTFMSRSRYSTHDNSVRRSRSEVFYDILSLAQARSVDFLHITQQDNLEKLGAGATAAVLQSYVNPRMSLAFKGPDDSKDEFSAAALERFFRELQILSIPEIRTHPLIATVEGIAWKVRDKDNATVPLLVFERANSGSLKKFMEKEEEFKEENYRERGLLSWDRTISRQSLRNVNPDDGLQTKSKGWELGINQRLALCCQISAAMCHLEKQGCIHGDLKPSNILVYEDHQKDGALCVRITDFGHATVIDGTGSRVELPQSKPWTIPAPEYHSQGHSLEAAIKAMVYSLGVCCLWLLLYNRPQDRIDEFSVEAEEAEATLSPTGMLNLCQKRLERSESINSTLKSRLSAIFQLALAPCENRAASAREVLLLLQEALSESSTSRDGCTHTDEKVVSQDYQFYPNLLGLKEQRVSFGRLGMLRFNVPLAMLFLHDVDSRVRQAIFISIRDCEAARQKDILADRWKQHCIELAMCHQLGFGTERDEMAALTCLRRSEVNDAGLKDRLGLVHWYSAAPYTPWTRWSENFNTDTVTTSYDLSYYLGRQSLGTVLRVHRRELEDWSAALGPQHWIVLEKQYTVVSFELAKGNGSKANETAREAYRVAMALNDSPNRWVRRAKARISLVRVLLFYRLYKEAEGLAQELLSSLTSSSDGVPVSAAPDHYLYVAEAKHLLASTHEGLSKLNSALKLRRENLATAEARLGDQHPRCFEHMVRLGLLIRQASWREHAHPEARALLKRAERIAKKGYGDNHEMTLVAQQHQQILVRDAFVIFVRRDPDQFNPDLLERYQFTLGNFSPATINAMENGVELLLQQHRDHEALRLMEHIVKLAAITYQDVPAQLKFYAKRYRGVLANAQIATLMGNWWFLKYANIPVGFDRWLNKERFHRRYELVVWPIHRVKECFKERKPFEFDWSKDPDYSEQDKEMIGNMSLLKVLDENPRFLYYLFGTGTYRRLQAV